MIELREYQKDLLSRVQSELQPDKARVMMQLPTGGGKTVIAAHLLKNWLTHGRKAVWLTHRKELAYQTRRMLYETAGIRVWFASKWILGNPAQALPNGAIILMAQTVSRRTVAPDVWSKYNRRDLMIIDEAHHATAEGYTRAMEHWPGRIVGMTATPWRLSQKEGFDHLFKELLRGPDVPELQGLGFLCNAEVLLPAPDRRIQGGEIGSMGDYTETGIQLANQEHIMTAGVLEFWENHAHDRQTIIYAVSVGHARNLMAVYEEAGVSAGIMLGVTPQEERDATIAKFSKGALKVLVNVAVATEGFDLPDASCVIIARPTESLALYLQMLGRGLRPKPNDGDCLILDMTGNAIIHGLPEQPRKWSLAPRGQPPEGEAPVVWCGHCGAVSYAASHNCRSCGSPFGEDCQRCGKWRSWRRWSLKYECEYAHDIVCNRCHRDAHIQKRLPVTARIEALAELNDEDREMPTYNSELDDRLASVIKDLLEEERLNVMNEPNVLREFIKIREAELSDDSVLDELFEEYLTALPPDEEPKSRSEESRIFGEWESNLKTELSEKKNELVELESHPIDSRVVLDNVRSRVLSALEHESTLAGLSSHSGSDADKIYSPNPSVSDTGRVSLAEFNPPKDPPSPKPEYLEFHSGEIVEIASWRDFLVEVANYLIRKDSLTSMDCPVHSYSTRPNSSNLIVSRRDSSVRRELSNGTFISVNMTLKYMIRQARYLLSKFDEDPANTYIHLMPEWLSLTSPELREQAGQTPSLLRLPSGEERPISAWAHSVFEIANWLIQEGKLSQRDCPLSLGKAQRYLINNTPYHSDGNKFGGSRQLSNGTYINTQLGSIRQIISIDRRLLSKFGVAPSQFHIKFR